MVARLAEPGRCGRKAGGGGVSRVCAIIAARNEETYARSLFPYLVENDVDFYIIDHGSTDRTRQIAQEFEGRGLVGIEYIPFEGVFSLSEILSIQARIVQSLPHAWVLHHDMDEILQHPEEGCRLVDLAVEADAAGANVVNFDEFVFPPMTSGVGEASRYRARNLDYYFFEPMPKRLMRLWRRDANLSNARSGGHRLNGDVRLFSTTGQLRHYISLSQDHILKKYLNRSFAAADLRKGWHSNRVGLTETMLDLSRIPAGRLHRCLSQEDRNLKTDRPFFTHFWQW